MTQTLLIFPGGYGDGPDMRDRARQLGLRVLGASSVQRDPVCDTYDRWSFLPHVSEAAFDDALGALIEANDVTAIHVTHYIVWHHVSKTLPARYPHVRISLGRSNFDLEEQYRALRQRVAEKSPPAGLEHASEPRPVLSDVEAAGYLRAALSIPGESYEPKLLALVEAARRAPAGDIVEVGCLFGRTAAFIALLSRRYDLGNVLCVDPWLKDEIAQGDALLHEASLGYDWASWRTIFEINVAPYAFGRLNYLQATSAAAAPRYAPGLRVRSDAFGETAYDGAIALLHIDANHAYEHVLADTRAWTPKLAPGGWIVFDDYEWDWGDGPRRVADEFLAARAGDVRAHFLAGGAMFVEMKA